MTREWRAHGTVTVAVGDPFLSWREITPFMEELIAWWPSRPSDVGILGGTAHLQWLADAFREPLDFGEPIKPEEPFGLGAVVEDADGKQWIRLHTHRDCNDWYAVKENTYRAEDVNVSGRRKYAEIAAVKVLSEGVVA